MDHGLDFQELLKSSAGTVEFSMLILSRMEQKIKDGSLSLPKFMKRYRKHMVRKKVKAGI